MNFRDILELSVEIAVVMALRKNALFAAAQALHDRKILSEDELSKLLPKKEYFT